MIEPVDPAPTVSFEDITFRCTCGEVITLAWETGFENDGDCPACGAEYGVSADPHVDITVYCSGGQRYCEGSY